MIKTLFNPTIIAEWAAYFAALFLLQKEKGVWRLFIPVLQIILVAETVGWILSYIFKLQHNGWLFNINMLIYLPFFICVIATAEPVEHLLKYIYLPVSALIVFFVLNALTLQGILLFQSYTFILGEMLLIFICLYFFYRIVRENTYRNLFNYAYFWLANAFLLNGVGNVVFFAFYHLVTDADKAKLNHVYAPINYILNVILYGSFIIAFLCREKTRKLLLA